MRKTKTIKIQDRAQELTFEVTEMSAVQLERWIARAFLLLASSGVEVPDGTNIEKAATILSSKGLNILSSIDYEKAEPLLNELLGCCSRVVEGVREKCTPHACELYIFEVATLLKLKKEALELNLGFLSGGIGNLFGSQEKAS
jgi:hypothetical protein